MITKFCKWWLGIQMLDLQKSAHSALVESTEKLWKENIRLRNELLNAYSTNNNKKDGE